MRTRYLVLVVLAFGGVLGWLTASGRLPCISAAEPKSSPEKLDRTVLPIPEPKIVPSTVLDARNAKAPPRFEVKAPARRPTC